jgi:FtsP/CotA-like multicopper oxidase with cupredoxin domain
MSRNQRLGLVAAVVAIAVVAFVIAKPGGDDANEPASTPANTSEPKTTGTQTGEAPAPKPKPAVTRIAIRGGEVQGGVRTITAKKGDTVRIVVTSDAPDELHLHGFDIEKEAAPGKPARFVVKANIEGVFELESHTAEHAGREPAVARLRVEPA